MIQTPLSQNLDQLKAQSNRDTHRPSNVLIKMNKNARLVTSKASENDQQGASELKGQAERDDIWQHPDAAEFVRSVANGNETVPTVTVGDVAVVNPPLPSLIV